MVNVWVVAIVIARHVNAHKHVQMDAARVRDNCDLMTAFEWRKLTLGIYETRDHPQTHTGQYMAPRNIRRSRARVRIVSERL